MDTLAPEVVSALDPRVARLIERHTTFAIANSPACSDHTMTADELSDADMTMWAIFKGDTAVAMGALKPLAGANGELKSMHVLDGHRGDGLADKILTTVMRAGRAAGMTAIFLETGSQPPFEAARAFYSRHGFDFCLPFEGYVEDPASVFMTRAI